MKRLSIDAIRFIKDTDRSYSELIKELNQKFGIKTAKSSISYYKRGGPRIKHIKISAISECELEWLYGLYFADGCKFKDRYSHILKFSLDYAKDIDIARKVIELLQKIGLKPCLSRDKGSLVIRVGSKELYYTFPSKSENYRPNDSAAFLSGLIDGDGYVKNNLSAYIVQYKHDDLMSYLATIFKLSKIESNGVSGWGEPRKFTAYYVPISVGKVLLMKGNCIKLLRKTSKAKSMN